MNFIDWENEYDRIGDFEEDSSEEGLPDEKSNSAQISERDDVNICCP